MKPIVKVCGMRDPQLIDLCIQSGTKLIGFILNYPKSPRNITFDQLAELTKNIPEEVDTVAVMVNPSLDDVGKANNYVNTLQLHGDETNEFIKEIKEKFSNLKIFKALKIKEKKDLEQIKNYPDADNILLDTPAMGDSHASAFNFNLLEGLNDKNFFLAGKISSENVKTALKYTNMIDVNSSLEEEVGIKSADKISKFFKELNTYEN